MKNNAACTAQRVAMSDLATGQGFLGPAGPSFPVQSARTRPLQKQGESMKVELKDVHHDELSQFAQAIYRNLTGFSQDRIADIIQDSMRAVGDHRRVVTDGENIWVLE